MDRQSRPGWWAALPQFRFSQFGNTTFSLMNSQKYFLLASLAVLATVSSACSTHKKDSTRTRAEGAAIGETIGGLFGAPGAIAGALIGQSGGKKASDAKVKQSGQEKKLESQTAATRADSQKIKSDVAKAENDNQKKAVAPHTTATKPEKESGGVKRIFGL